MNNRIILTALLLMISVITIVPFASAQDDSDSENTAFQRIDQRLQTLTNQFASTVIPKLQSIEDTSNGVLERADRMEKTIQDEMITFSDVTTIIILNDIILLGAFIILLVKGRL